ncbi:MAG TPA: hypothetical protein VMC85_15720 [Desulfomonilaceae bacterium]|nr:hypothetical protein [Desulfomonilaceae bacterium]
MAKKIDYSVYSNRMYMGGIDDWATDADTITGAVEKVREYLMNWSGLGKPKLTAMRKPLVLTIEEVETDEKTEKSKTRKKWEFHFLIKRVK